jgi:hypothetical protein
MKSNVGPASLYSAIVFVSFWVMSLGGCAEGHSESNAPQTLLATTAVAALPGSNSGLPDDGKTLPSELPQQTLSRLRDALFADATETDKVPSFAVLTHLLLLDGREAVLAGEGSEVKILSLLTDSALLEERLRRPVLVQTRQGVAYLPRSESGESHRDQVLAAMAQRNVSLDWPILAGSRRYAVQDLLNDSTANFHLQQMELPWTAIAYAHYLPPERSWTNKFGVRFSFDDLAARLMGDSLADASCGGLHQLFSLTEILKSQRRSSILTDHLADRVDEYLKRCIAAVITTQGSDGAWQPRWVNEIYRAEAPLVANDEDSPRSKLLVTGHMLEWLRALPVAMQPPDDIMQRAAHYLLLELDRIDDEAVREQFCPVIHSILALQH